MDDYQKKLPPLTVKELQKILIDNEELQWHPLRTPHALDDQPPFRIDSIQEEVDPHWGQYWIVETEGATKVGIDKNGYTVLTKVPAFLPYVLPPEPEPRNNDGRSKCYWCKATTRKAGGGQYDLCPFCGK